MTQLQQMDSTIERLQKRIELLEQENGALRKKVLIVPYNDAKTLIKATIRKFKEDGKKYFNVLDLHFETHLSFPILNKIMTELEKMGEVSDGTEEFIKND